MSGLFSNVTSSEGERNTLVVKGGRVARRLLEGPRRFDGETWKLLGEVLSHEGA
jgi:hypothetical protein